MAMEAGVLKAEVRADADAVAQRGAELIVAAAREAVAARGEFSLALSGGRTPWRMVALFSDVAEMPWGETRIFQVDERVAPPGDEQRNLTHLVQMLAIEHQAAVRPMPVTSRDLDAAAREYEAQLPERFDLVHLGLGHDGHTASLVPGDPVLDATDRSVAVTPGEYEGHRRMTLTYPALAAARRILWLVTGEEKRDALARLLAGDRSIPAGRVENGEMVVIADEAAAVHL
jgi:6-phosphogluconolactonase